MVRFLDWSVPNQSGNGLAPADWQRSQCIGTQKVCFGTTGNLRNIESRKKTKRCICYLTADQLVRFLDWAVPNQSGNGLAPADWQYNECIGTEKVCFGIRELVLKVVFSFFLFQRKQTGAFANRMRTNGSGFWIGLSPTNLA